MSIHEDTCLHGSGCADVPADIHIVGTGHYAAEFCWHIYARILGTGHYADGFCWFLCVCILSLLYLGPYQSLARPDILHLLTISGTGSLIPRPVMLW